MSKKNNVLRVQKFLDSYNIKYEVKNYLNDLPSHLRLQNGVDVWPSTGTYKKDNVHTKGSINNLMNYLHELAGVNKPKDSLKEKEVELSSEIKSLNKLITRLESKVDTLETKINSLAVKYTKLSDTTSLKENLLRMERRIDELEQSLEFSSFNR